MLGLSHVWLTKAPLTVKSREYDAILLDEIPANGLKCWSDGAEYEHVSITVPQLVGREEELQAIFRVLEERELLPGVAVLSGEAGIGKTALWLAGLDAAAGAGLV